MANTVPAATPAPDIGLLIAGGGLDAAAVAELFAASNFGAAYNGSGTPRVSQSWARRGNTTPAPFWSYATAAANRLCRWRIPDTRGVTQVKCYAWGSSTGGGGLIEWRSTVAGAVTGTQALPTTPGLIGPFALTIDASGGFEEIVLWADATGGALSVDSVLVVVPPEASPLAAGLTAGALVPFDSSEFGVDLPLGVDSGRAMRANLALLRAVPHVYWQWSGLADTDLGSTGKFMRSVPHIIPVPVWLDTDREGWDLSVHVYATSLAGASEVRVHAMLPTGDPIRSLTLAVGAAAADGWYSGTLRLPGDHRVLHRLAHGLQTVMLGIMPAPTAAGSVARFARLTGIEERHLTTARVRAVSVWGA